MSLSRLAEAAGISRASLSRLESMEYTPSLDQLERLGQALDFDPASVFAEPAEEIRVDHPVRIAVAGTGYVGLSLAVLLAQHHPVTAVDIVPEKVEKLNRMESPIQDDYIERFLEEAKAGTRTLALRATCDAAAAYAEADYVIVAAPTNYARRWTR